MSYAAILIGVALLLASILLVTEPLFRNKRLQSFARRTARSDTHRNYEQTLLAIRDLDFDHQLGILTDADYQQQRISLMTKAAVALENRSEDVSDVKQLIEVAVQERRRKIGNGNSQCSNCGADVEQTDKFCSACGHFASLSCSRCNQQIEEGDHFCTSCGAHLVTTNGVLDGVVG